MMIFGRPKVEITAEMVALARAQAKLGVAGPADRMEIPEDSMRAILDAALNPPAEPDIPVSEGMREAGERVWLISRPQSRTLQCVLAQVYRAMEKKRREETGPLDREHRRITDGPHWPPVDFTHRRKSDP